MSKKFFIGIISLILTASMCMASSVGADTIRGISKLEDKMSLKFMNRLQAVADNDGVEFSRIWPKEYFGNTITSSYMYALINGFNTLEMVKFDYTKAEGDCFVGENPNFCLPKLSLAINKYSYNNRLIVENTPDFVNAPNSSELLELLVSKGEYIDKKYITKLPETVDDVKTYQKCSYDKSGRAEVCKTYEDFNDELMYVEKLDKRGKASEVFKYSKLSADGKLMEEYYYQTGKHVFYDKDEQVETFYQVSDDKFRYYSENFPELYVETVFLRDESGKVIEEQVFDRNHRLVRDYKAEYKSDSDELSKIIVKDRVNVEEWEILPIGINDIGTLPFKIRM